MRTFPLPRWDNFKALYHRWAFGGCLLLSALLGIAYYPRVRDTLLRQEGWLVEVHPTTASVVLARESDSESVTVAIRNVSEKHVRVVGIDTTCSCVVGGGQLPMELGPRQTRHLTLTVRSDPKDLRTSTQAAKLFLDVPSPPVVMHLIISRRPAARNEKDKQSSSSAVQQ